MLKCRQPPLTTVASPVMAVLITLLLLGLASAMPERQKRQAFTTSETFAVNGFFTDVFTTIPSSEPFTHDFFSDFYTTTPASEPSRFDQCDQLNIPLNDTSYRFSSQDCQGASPNYPNNANYTVTFTLPSNRIVVSYRIETEPGYDYVTFGEGLYNKLRISGSQSDSRQFLLNNNTFTVSFRSDGSVTQPGFSFNISEAADIETTTPYFTTQQVDLCSAPEPIDLSIHDLLYEPFFFSLRGFCYNASYPANANYLFTFILPELTFGLSVNAAVDTEPGYDYLTIGSGTEMISGLVNRVLTFPNATSNGDEFYVSFMSDGNVQREGFNLTFIGLREPCSLRTIDVYELPFSFSSTTCSGGLDYPNDADWTLNFNLQDEGIYFVEYYTDVEYVFDTLTIGEGLPNSVSITGRQNGTEAFQILGARQLTVNFNSDSSVTRSGFDLVISVPDRCDERYIEVTQFPFYFNSQYSCFGAFPNYPEHSNWTLHFNLPFFMYDFYLPYSQNIAVNYSASTERGFDVLILGNGPSSVNVTGLDQQGTAEFEVNFGVFPVHFQSDYSIQEKGFNLTIDVAPDTAAPYIPETVPPYFTTEQPNVCEDLVINVTCLNYTFNSRNACYNGSSTYPNHAQYRVSFILPETENGIALEYSILTEPNYDFVTLGLESEPISGTVRGTKDVSCGELIVVFTSDYSVTSGGFNLTFYESESEALPAPAPDTDTAMYALLGRLSSVLDLLQQVKIAITELLQLGDSDPFDPYLIYNKK